jgi:uncharacterized membrane protein affecting hemolysin expression
MATLPTPQGGWGIRWRLTEFYARKHIAIIILLVIILLVITIFRIFALE